MTRSNVIPMVLFIAIAVSVGLNPPEANEVVPQSSVQQSGSSMTDNGITNFDTNTIVNSQTNITPLAGSAASAINSHSSELVSTPSFVPQPMLGDEQIFGTEFLPKGGANTRPVSSGDFAFTAIYGVGGNVLAQN